MVGLGIIIGVMCLIFLGYIAYKDFRREDSATTEEIKSLKERLSKLEGDKQDVSN